MGLPRRGGVQAVSWGQGTSGRGRAAGEGTGGWVLAAGAVGQSLGGRGVESQAEERPCAPGGAARSPSILPATPPLVFLSVAGRLYCHQKHFSSLCPRAGERGAGGRHAGAGHSLLPPPPLPRRRTLLSVPLWVPPCPAGAASRPPRPGADPPIAPAGPGSCSPASPAAAHPLAPWPRELPAGPTAPGPRR